MPSCRPTNSVKAIMANQNVNTNNYKELGTANSPDAAPGEYLGNL